MLTSMRKYTFFFQTEESIATMYKKWHLLLESDTVWLDSIHIYIYSIQSHPQGCYACPKSRLIKRLAIYVGGSAVLECIFQSVCNLITFVWNGKCVYEHLTEHVMSCHVMPRGLRASYLHATYTYELTNYNNNNGMPWPRGLIKEMHQWLMEGPSGPLSKDDNTLRWPETKD